MSLEAPDDSAPKTPSLEATDISPTVIKPADITPTPIEPAVIQPAEVSPSSIEPTSIKPTEITPTEVTPTRITPTEVTPGGMPPSSIPPSSPSAKPAKPFSYSSLLTTAFVAVACFAAFFIALQIGLSTLFQWLAALLVLLIGFVGVLGFFQEILKLPLTPEMIAAINSALKPNQKPIDPASLGTAKKIIIRVKTSSVKIRVTTIVATIAFSISIVACAISGGVAVVGSLVPNTDITGEWDHELWSIDNEGSWLWTTAMGYDFSRSDTGTLVMTVLVDGTFTLSYQSSQVGYGEWTEPDDNDYHFVYHDPDGVLASTSYDYFIRGNGLLIDGGSSVYFSKA